MKNRNLIFVCILIGCPAVIAFCIMMGPAGFGFPNPATQREILFLRISRVLAGLVVGAALSTSGVALQAILRNPLAEPYVLGVSSGAGLGAAMAILAGFRTFGALSLPVSAFILAMATLIVVYALSSGTGISSSLYGLILSGVIVSSVCSSFLMFLVSVAPAEGMHSILWWMLGNLDVSSHALLAITATIVLTGCFGIWLLSPELNAITLGHDMAHFIGIRVRMAIVIGLLLATLITAAVVAMSGLIGFVGLIIPHVMRSLVGPDHRRLIPAVALGGGAFLALCDSLARTVMSAELPVGVITAMVGGPFFLILLKRRQKKPWCT